MEQNDRREKTRTRKLRKAVFNPQKKNKGKVKKKPLVQIQMKIASQFFLNAVHYYEYIRREMHRYDDYECTTVQRIRLEYLDCTPKRLKKYDASPMEVDSFEDVANSNLKAWCDTKQKTNESRKFSQSLDSVSNNNRKLGYKTKIALVVFVIFLLFLLCLPIWSVIVQCECEVNVETIRKELTRNVYNQAECVNLITSSLAVSSEWLNKFKVLVFMGTMGVGKTFVANIVKSHFPKDMVHEIIHADQKLNNNVCCNLIVIDNLNVKSINDTIQLLTSLNDYRFTLVLALFNIYKTDKELNYFFDQEAVSTILHEFTASGLYFESCLFNYINETDVDFWLKDEFIKRKIKKEFQENIRRYVVANSNLTRNGFKGLSQKLAVATEIFTELKNNK